MKFSVIIITRNRREDLKETIEAFEKQTYIEKEIIVVDNGSSDGTDRMVEDIFPNVKYIYLPDNFDIRAINIGVYHSTGDVIWRTDSDSYPESSDTFSRIADIFDKHPEISIIATEDVEVKSNNSVWDWYPLRVDKLKVPDDGYQAHMFAGTGAAIRKEVFDKIGGFWEFGFEEMDFCTRAIAAGFKIRYYPNIRILHFSSPHDRDKSNRWVQISRQYVRYVWKYFPFYKALGRTFVHYFFQLLFAIFARVDFSAIIEGMLSMLAVIFYTIRNERNVLPKEKINEVTLGVNFLKVNLIFTKELIKKRLNRWKES